MATSSPVNLNDPISSHAHGSVYGGPGVGKTILTCGSRRLRTFMFDVDNGRTSLQTWPGIDRGLVTVWPVSPETGKDDFFRGLDWLRKYDTYYDLVTIDTATELQKLILAEICRKNKQAYPDQRCWGEILLFMEEISRILRSWSKHVIFVCHEIQELDEESRRLMYQPSFQGSYQREYAKHFDFIWRYAIADRQVKDANGQVSVNVTRYLQTQRNQFCHAKDRYNALDMFETPDIDTMFGKMFAKIAANNTKTK